MRRFPVLFVALAALLVASIAIAAKPLSGTAAIEQLGASGISGTADIKIDQDGNARVHEQLVGLTPGETYESVFYLSASTCGTGTPVVIMAEFTANPAGRANFVVEIPPAVVPFIAGGSFISVEQGTTQLACGEVEAQ